MQKRGEKANQKCRRTEKVEKRERERGDENPNPNSSFETPCHSVDIPLELTSPLALFLQFLKLQFHSQKTHLVVAYY